jgi:hypothetical protein
MTAEQSALRMQMLSTTMDNNHNLQGAPVCGAGVDALRLIHQSREPAKIYHLVVNYIPRTAESEQIVLALEQYSNKVVEVVFPEEEGGEAEIVIG